MTTANIQIVIFPPSASALFSFLIQNLWELSLESSADCTSLHGRSCGLSSRSECPAGESEEEDSAQQHRQRAPDVPAVRVSLVATPGLK